jgi:hypothetical protein
MQPFTDAVFSFFSDNMPSECLSGANWERAIIVSLARTLGEVSGQLGKKEARKSDGKLRFAPVVYKLTPGGLPLASDQKSGSCRV